MVSTRRDLDRRLRASPFLEGDGIGAKRWLPSPGGFDAVDADVVEEALETEAEEVLTTELGLTRLKSPLAFFCGASCAFFASVGAEPPRNVVKDNVD